MPSYHADIYMPGPDGGPPEPAPFLMTEEEAARFLRLDNQDPTSSLTRYRQKGWLRATQVGKHLRYRLPDLIEFLKRAQEENPR